MREPLQISFHNMAPSDALERRVREHWARVERHCADVVSARVVLEAAHRQPHKSTLGITISIGVPGRDIVVKREQRLHESDHHATWVINEAFHTAERQLEEYAQKQRHEVKAHEGEREYARVAALAFCLSRLHRPGAYFPMPTERIADWLKVHRETAGALIRRLDRDGVIRLRRDENGKVIWNHKAGVAREAKYTGPVPAEPQASADE